MIANYTIVIFLITYGLIKVHTKLVTIISPLNSNIQICILIVACKHFQAVGKGCLSIN